MDLQVTWLLKQAESFYSILKSRNINDPYFDNYNYENYGGTPILGINKTVVVGHGISNDIAIKNMILLTRDIIKTQLTEKITKAFEYGTN
jgi:phosphate acyltransferase